jgi:hypothetical protein
LHQFGFLLETFVLVVENIVHQVIGVSVIHTPAISRAIYPAPVVRYTAKQLTLPIISAMGNSGRTALSQWLRQHGF